MRYKCKKMIRVGGKTSELNGSNYSQLDKIEGSWFICLDEQLAPKKDDCTVLSFGLKNDSLFDEEMSNDCRVFSFQVDSVPVLKKKKVVSNPNWTIFKYKINKY